MLIFAAFIFSSFLALLNADNAVNKSAPVQTCFSSCHCEDYPDGTIRAYCRNKNLKTFPLSSDFPKPVKYLDLKDNEITEVKEIENFSQLEYLSLSNNNLKVLSPATFAHLKNLKNLDLSYNPIGSFHEKQFSVLENLLTLNVSSCQIQSFSNDLFENLKELVHLEMGDNPLRYFDSKLLAPLNRLIQLSMRNNEFFSLPSDALVNLQHLNNLDLSKNHFKEVPTTTLRAVKNLKELDLSENPIEKLNRDSFFQLNSLRSLKLRRLEKVFEIEAETFSPLYNLEDLAVDDNPLLFTIDPAAFKGMFNSSWSAIKNVSFRRNRLGTLSQKTLPFCKLQSLDLRENPWICDCHMHWVTYCHDRGHFVGSVECALPRNMRGHFIETIDVKFLVCTENASNVPAQVQNAYVFYMTFFMMCSIFCIAIFLYKIRYSNSRPDQHSSIYYLKAQTEAN